MISADSGDVVITGTGIISAAGRGAEPLLVALGDGRSFLQQHGSEPWPSARVDDEFFPWPSGPTWADLKKYASRSAHLAVAAAMLALEEAGLPSGEIDAQRSATVCVVQPDPSEWEPLAALLTRVDDSRPLALRIYEDLPDFHVLRAIPTQVTQLVALAGGFEGPSTAVAYPSMGGLVGVALALRMLASGEVDRVLVAGADPLGSPHFRAAFDRLRTGTHLGEGAAALVIELQEQARLRNARVLARVLACENRCTPGAASSLELAVDAAVAQAQRRPDVVRAHGSAAGVIGNLLCSSALLDVSLAALCLRPDASTALVSAFSHYPAGGAAAAIIAVGDTS